VIERIAAYPWPRGGVSVRKLRGGYSLSSARTGAPVARLKPMPQDDRFEVLWWRRDAWGSAGPFGAGLSLNDALEFIASEPPFWIRARSHWPVMGKVQTPPDTHKQTYQERMDGLTAEVRQKMPGVLHAPLMMPMTGII
jgi:hypothetical protein